MKILKFENAKYEILVEKYIFIKDKESNQYYRNDFNSIDRKILNGFSIYNEKIGLNTFKKYIYFTIFMIIVNYIYVLNLQKIIKPDFDKHSISIITLYFAINITLHEIGHIKSLNYFGKKINKIGFKLNFYVFPAIYVQMNEIYMISRKEKIIVHSFGLFVNFTFINLVQIINEFTVNNVSLTIAFMLFSSTMIWNLIPMLNSDGYKVLLAILYLDEYNNFIKNHWLVLSLQILGVLIALNTLIHWITYWLKYLIY